MSAASYTVRAAQAASALWRGRMARNALWLAGPFALQQLIRLVTSIVLARLLAPEMFGVMVLVNTLRTGTELLSDIGIGQSVVRSPHANDRAFLDTAWTVQLVRGALLALLALIAAWPVAQIYGNPQLAPVLCIIGATFLLTGLNSPDLFLMQRDMRVVQRGIYDLGSTITVSLITILLAALWRDLWALVWGLVLGAACATLLTYAFAPPRVPRLTWRREYVAEIFHFGKWIFLSTAIYFAAISIDKIYFSAVLPLALVGVYGVARTFSDLMNALAQRFGSFLVFPRVAELHQQGSDLAPIMRGKRRLVLAASAAAMAAMLAASDQLILLLYDARYAAAAFMLPLLLAGVWFAVLSSLGEATLFGLGLPQAGAAGNAAKFAVLVAGLPLLVPAYGLTGGLFVLIAAEMGRWLALSLALNRKGLSSGRDDLLATVLVAIAAVIGKGVLGYWGLVPTLQQWWGMSQTVAA